MMRKSRLGDGMKVGVTVCDVTSIRAAVDAERANGPWPLAPNRRGTNGWSLAEVALQRALSGLSLQRVSSETGTSLSGVRRWLAIRAKLMDSDAEYSERVGLLGTRALEALPPVVGEITANNGATRYCEIHQVRLSNRVRPLLGWPDAGELTRDADRGHPTGDNSKTVQASEVGCHGYRFFGLAETARFRTEPLHK
jgi:hypothetical protein